MPAATPTTAAPSAALRPEETAFIGYFVRIAQAFGLPKSLGELFGFLFAQGEPVAFEDVVERLGLSKGSASQGLRFLQRINAVRTDYRVGDRRTYYSAEVSLRQLFAGLLDETVLPHLRESREALPGLEALVAETPDPARRAVLKDRVGRLRNWTTQTNRFLPLFLRLIGPGKAEGKNGKAETLKS